MDENLGALDERLRLEAETLLEKQGLLPLLQRYGKPHTAGAYFLRTMAFKDLDILLEAPNMVDAQFFALGGELASLLCPRCMTYRNERAGADAGLPRGLHWDIHLGEIKKGAWRIGVWALPSWEVEKIFAHLHDIKTRLNPSRRLHVLAIKDHLWRSDDYGTKFDAQDIYAAVLNRDITTPEDFLDTIEGA